MSPKSPRIAWGALALGLFLGLGTALEAALPSQPIIQPPKHGYMPLDSVTLERWAQERAQAPTAYLRPRAAEVGAQAGAVAGVPNLLGDISTVGASRDQGSNGNCWVWASSAMAEVALKESYGFKDSLSIEYVDSLMTTTNWVQGGLLLDYCRYVNGTGILVPTSNANAAYVDGIVNGLSDHSLIPTSAIQLSPAYTQVNVKGSTVPTYHVGQATAIANIKNILGQRKAVSFGFITRFGGAGGFTDWWANNPETVLWPEPVGGSSGAPDGAHMIVIVGYDESDPAPANHYWIVLNSWGISANRPNGLLRLPMVMNYDASFTMSGKTYPNFTFETLDLTADHPSASAPSVTATPSTTMPELGQPLTFTATVTGYPPFTYQWRKDGQVIPEATSAAYTVPYLVSTDAGHSYDVVVSNVVGGVPVNTISPAVIVPSMAGQQQLLLNPGFEDGASQTAWTITANPNGWGGGGFRNAPANSHSGGWGAFIGETNSFSNFAGALEQTLTIPSGPGSVLLSHWVNASTGRVWGPGRGSLLFTVKDAATGQLLRTGKTHNNLNPSSLLWSQDQFGLSDLKGQRVTVHIEWDAQLCQWRLDDFAVTVNPSDSRPLPVITSFSPASGNPLDPVVLTGSGFTGTTLVQFNGLATAFTVDSDTQITTTVPKSSAYGNGGDSVTSGPLAVNTPIGTAFSATPFRVLRPIISSYVLPPTSRGSAVVLAGSGFTGTTTIVFDGVAGPALIPATFTVDSDTQITLTVPIDAISGFITLATPYGTARSQIRVLPNGSVSLTIDPTPLAVMAGSTLTFTTTVMGDIDQRVTSTYSSQTATNYSQATSSSNPLTFTLDSGAIGSLNLTVNWIGDYNIQVSQTIPVKNLDFLGTGIVDVLDMLELAKRYGTKTGDVTFNAAEDLNGDGIISDSDVTLFMNHF